MGARVVVITGTDTEVGKTHIGCALARQLGRNGVAVRAGKPAEAGHVGTPTASEDGVRLAKAAGQKDPAHALQRLQMAVAPPVAADAEGVELQFEAWMEACEVLAEQCGVLIVEGAGGLMSPLTWEHSALDVAERLGASLIVVSADRLGVLNHTLLTLEVAKSHGVPVLGVVLNEATERDHDASRTTNARSLRKLRPGVRVHEVDFESGDEALEPLVSWVTE